MAWPRIFWPLKETIFKSNMLNTNLLLTECEGYKWGLLFIKNFPRFWLVKTTHIIYHNQLLLTKYWTNDVKSAARYKLYITDDIKMTSTVQPLADYWTVGHENLGTKLCYIWWAEKQRAKWWNSFKNREMFWMNNEAIIEFGFRRIWRIL